MSETPTEDRGDAVPAVTDAGLVVTAFPWQITPPEDVLVVVVKGTFDLVPDAPAVARAESDLPEDDLFEGDTFEGALLQSSDFAVMKPEVDVLVRGTAYAPSKGATAMQVAVRVKGAHGAVDRAIAVFGDRTWGGAGVARVPSAPAPFESIPLGYGRAFGGPGYEKNPNGVGAGAAPSADGVRRLPNFEEIGKLVTSPDDSVSPAGLGGIHPEWAVRRALLGTYDKTWFRSRWPYYPEDFDHKFFQAAPPNQRLPRASGDESYELVGLHPSHGTLRGQLPGVRARVFAKRASEPALVEIPIRLDTITFAADDDALHLVWRGTVRVTDDDAPEIEHLFATTEPTVGPALTAEEIRARWVASLEEPPDDVDEPEPDEEEPVEGESESDVEARAIDAKLEAMEAEIMGAGDGAAAPAEPVPEPDPAVIAELLREAEAPEEDIQAVLAGMRGEEPVAVPEPDPEIRKEVERHLAEGEPLAGLDLRGADLSDMDLSAQDLEGLDFTGAKLDRSNLSSAALAGAKLVDASLVGANLEGAQLLDADLSGASVEGASLVGAVLDRIEARGLRAAGADFTKAILGEAMLAEGDLTGCKFAEASLVEADLSDARIDGATFARASMTDVRLYRVKGEKVIFDYADLSNARAEGAQIPRASLRDVVANDSVWEKANLSGATLLGASLVAASFHKATCEKTIFGEADLTNGRLAKANLKGAMLVKANLFEAKLDRANLEGADLRGSNLHGTSLLRASMKGAQLDNAITSYSDLDRRQG